MATPKNQYELTYILSGVLNEQQIRQTIDKVNRFIEENEGEILNVDEWGSQRLAYRIDKKRSGYYVNMYFRAPGQLIGRLERAMKINDNILRFLTLRMDAKMQRHYERQRQERQQQEQPAEETAE